MHYKEFHELHQEFTHKHSSIAKKITETVELTELLSEFARKEKLLQFLMQEGLDKIEGESAQEEILEVLGEELYEKVLRKEQGSQEELKNVY